MAFLFAMCNLERLGFEVKDYCSCESKHKIQVLSRHNFLFYTWQLERGVDGVKYFVGYNVYLSAPNYRHPKVYCVCPCVELIATPASTAREATTVSTERVESQQREVFVVSSS